MTGFVCGDVDQLAESCGRVDQLDRSACRQSVERYFCTQRMVQDHIRLFRRLIAEREALGRPR